MEYDRGDSFPYDFRPNRIPFGSNTEEKLSPRSYSIQFERNNGNLFKRFFRRTNIYFCKTMWPLSLYSRDSDKVNMN